MSFLRALSLSAESGILQRSQSTLLANVWVTFVMFCTIISPVCALIRSVWALARVIMESTRRAVMGVGGGSGGVRVGGEVVDGERGMGGERGVAMVGWWLTKH